MKDRDSPDSQRHTSRDSNEFSRAVNRLEKAVQDVVSATTDQISERATSLLDDTTKRLESELRLNRFAGSSDEFERKRTRRRRRHRQRHRFSDRADRFARRGRKLTRSRNGKIAGVCAGLANYYGVDTWMVRIGWLTGLIFLPGIVFPAYWVAYFVMCKDSENKIPERQDKTRSAAQAEPAVEVSSRVNQEASPRRSLRRTSEDFSQAELRLRRLETYVTSNQYELQKEITKIEREEGAA